MKKLWIVLLCAGSYTAVSAQAVEKTASIVGDGVASLVDGWSFGGVGAITFNQVGLKNWSAGGDPSISFQLAPGFDAELRKGKHLWQNSLLVNYGIQKIKGQPFRKNCDAAEAVSKYGFQIDQKGKWYFSMLASGKTSFSKTFTYDTDGAKSGVISKIGSPLVVDAAVGVDFMPNDKFSLFMSPAALKWIIVADDDIAALNLHGNKGKNVDMQVGAMAFISYKQEVYKNVTIGTGLKIYKNYLAGPMENIDVDWQTNIGLQVNKFIAANVFLHLIWDYDVDTDFETPNMQRNLQFKDVIGVGFSYSFRGKDDAG